MIVLFKQKTGYEMLRSPVGSEMRIRGREWQAAEYEEIGMVGKGFGKSCYICAAGSRATSRESAR